MGLSTVGAVAMEMYTAIKEVLLLHVTVLASSWEAVKENLWENVLGSHSSALELPPPPLVVHQSLSLDIFWKC